MTLKRNLKRFLILWSSIFYCFSSLQNGFSHLQHGYRLDRKIINVFDNYSILDCVKECLRTARCQSVNYHKGANICEINYENKATGRDHYTPSYGWIYTNAIDWIRELTGVCLNSNCGTNETCIPLPSGDHRCALSENQKYTMLVPPGLKFSEIRCYKQRQCLLDCGVPVISGADMDSLGRWDAIGIERTMELECLGNYVKIGTGILRCTVSGQWTIDLSCGWHTFENHLYLFFPVLTTWELAKTQCMDSAAYLVEIESWKENKWIRNLMYDYCLKNAEWCHVWIGASDNAKESIFTWSRNGNPVTFTNWAYGQPDNAGRAEHCAHLYRNGQWNDAPCHVSLSFVCEKNLS